MSAHGTGANPERQLHPGETRDAERERWQRSANEQIEITRRTALERDRLEAENARLREALERSAQHHHDTIRGSRLHDPERIEDFHDCPCKSCRAAAEALARPVVGKDVS